MPPTKRNQISAGAARVDITPPVGGDLTGFIGRNSSSIAVHDPLYVRAIALEQGKTKALLLSCDLLGLEAPFVAIARRAIERETGVPERHIMLASTHTHSGAACMYLRYCGDVDAGYMAHLLEWLVQAAREACSAVVPVTVASGVTEVAGVSVNRRVPDGPVDEEVDVVRFDDTQGQPVAAIVGFACHPIAAGGLNRQVSADYPGVLTQKLEGSTGAVTLFLNGASAQINPLLFERSRNAKSGSFDFVESIGSTLAGAALKIWPDLKRQHRTPLTVQYRDLSLPLQHVDEAVLAASFSDSAASIAGLLPELQEEAAYLQLKWAAAITEWAWETRDAHQNGLVPRSIPAEVQMVRLGELVLVAVPGELFLEFGQQIKRALAPYRAIVSTYTNGNFGYFPNRQAFAEGGYETEAHYFYGYPAAFSATAGSKMVTAAKEMHQSTLKG